MIPDFSAKTELVGLVVVQYLDTGVNIFLTVFVSMEDRGTDT